MLLYELRGVDDNAPVQFNEIARSNSINHLLCFDDVIGSGATFTECLFDDLGTVNSSDLATWLQRDEHKISILVAVASEEGIRAIENAHRCRGKVKVLAHRVLARDDTVFSPNLSVFENAQRRHAFRSTCRDIGHQLCPNYPLGWGLSVVHCNRLQYSRLFATGPLGAWQCSVSLAALIPAPLGRSSSSDRPRFFKLTLESCWVAQHPTKPKLLSVLITLSQRPSSGNRLSVSDFLIETTLRRPRPFSAA